MTELSTNSALSRFGENLGRVLKDKLWCVLKKLGLREWLVKIVQSMYRSI